MFFDYLGEDDGSRKKVVSETCRKWKSLQIHFLRIELFGSLVVEDNKKTKELPMYCDFYCKNNFQF